MPLVAYHNSWAYFARRFRLDFVGFVEPKPGVPPSPFHIASLISLMQARKARIIVRQPHEPERDVAFLAKRTGSKVVVLASSVGARAGRARLPVAVRHERRRAAGGGQAMMAALEFLWPPFLVAFCLVGIHAYFGIQVLTRNIVFVDLALAQIAALGATVAFMLGHPALGAPTYGYSLAFTLLAAVLLAFTRAWSARIPQEALIGVIYVVAAAAAILLIDRAPQGAEHLKQILTGNILLTGLEIGRRHRAALRRDRRCCIGSCARGCTTGSFAWEFVFYATFGVVVTSSVALAGVLLVFSFLIIPAAIGVLYADTIGRQLAIGWIAGTRHQRARPCGVVPARPADRRHHGLHVRRIAGGRGHALSVSARRCRPASRGAIVTLRWGVAALLAGSALLLMAAPRADQPLLDAAEYALPSLRTLYLNGTEAATYEDARRYAERYRAEAERLNAIEMKSRAQGAAIARRRRRQDVLVRAFLWRDAARRGIRHARGALTRPPAAALVRRAGDAGAGLADCAGRGHRGTAQDPEQGVTCVTSM